MAFPTGWLCKAALVVQHGQVTADQTAFPVLITEASFATNCPEILTTGDAHAAQSDGGDLRFSTDSAGASQIACEVVVWSQNATFASARAEIWVPRDILTGSDVTIYVWWSGGGGLSQPAAGASFGSQAVWDANYVAVHHFGDGTTLALTDSTANGNTLTNSGGSAASGIIGGAAAMHGYPDRIYRTSPSNFPGGSAARTIEAWVKNPSNSTGLFGYGAWPEAFNVFYQSSEVHLLTNNAPTVRFAQSWGTGWRQVAATLPSGTNMSNVLMYCDGASRTLTNLVSGTLNTSLTEHRIGGLPNITSNSNVLTGTIDEVRVSNIGRSASWIATGYNNQNSPGTFVIAGTRTDIGGGGGPFPHYTRRLLSGGFSPI